MDIAEIKEWFQNSDTKIMSNYVVEHCLKHYDQLQAERDRYREALEFYAESKHVSNTGYAIELGSTARQALDHGREGE